MRSTARVTAALCVAIGLAACGGNGSPAAPTSTGGGDTTPVDTNTITITSSGLDHQNIAIAAGTRVMFVNNDSRSHQMSSNPHPTHTDCPELNLAVLAPGQSGESGVLSTMRTCGFHDHENPGNTSLQGSVTIR